MDTNKGFEASYGTYPFPALVDFGLALSRLYIWSRGRRADASKA